MKRPPAFLKTNCMILQVADFRNEARIPGLLPESDLASPMNEVILESVESYIDKYEPDFMRRFTTREKYEEILEYISLPESDRNDDRMDSIVARLKFSLSHYVAFYWFRTEMNTPIGGVSLQSENGTRIPTADIQVTLWNQMVANNKALYPDLNGKESPCGRENEIFEIVNKFNI